MNILVYKTKKDLLLLSGKIIPEGANIVLVDETAYWKEPNQTDSFHKSLTDINKDNIKIFDITEYFERIY
jgi:hypothetical protein